ncbi:MAG: MbtH family protein [Anaerolineae bacterium]|nr:MbtH family protein [Anaerolineae bacterium]MCB9130013.1 MbtH family protein [Anaerolineales bacterium]MCB0228287.1 MbtH family protein [Anaerolineae bacterium]MCB0236903.1 MbtH family protein [Anaerolineae bacterium]MCB0237869.1 MbtH family protein [Anaerolineae bacterium]
MSTPKRGDDFKVVINHEEQYSLWPGGHPNPHGWKDAGAAGTPEECVKFIERVTADSSPAKLRQRIEELQR